MVKKREGNNMSGGYDREKELREALFAGEQALSSLRQARDYLSSAGNWGFLDMLGGKTFSGLVKHSKLHSSKQCMERAKQDLRRFQRELDDVDTYLPDLQIGNFLTFADFFFDGFLADLMVQSKIGNARRQVDEAIYQVESILNRLRYELP